MKTTDFEKDLLCEFFRIEQIDPQELIESLDEIEVLDRTIEGSGYTIEFEQHPCLRVADADESRRWMKFGGCINEQKIIVGFIFYIENGYIESVEGYTYGEAWPDKIVCYELFQDQ